MMESSNFYELQQRQQIATFSSLAAAAQSTTAIQQWDPTPTLPLNNYDEYDHYMNEILPMSAQLNHINEHETRPNPCTYQIINQNLWQTTTSNSFPTHHQLGWNNNISPAAAAVSSSSTNIDYVLDSVITSSSSTSNLTTTNLPTDFMTNYFNNISKSSSSKTSACKDKAISRAKRVSGSSQNDAALKKQRAASHCSCPLPKVVKEKIGDRIAALHRLVAPFGKTDAASVLTEALGYIQFLHHQIQTLSMSCIKPSQNRLRCFERVSSKHKGKECWDAKQASDLKSRGLSLVPISLAAYVSSSTSVGLD